MPTIEIITAPERRTKAGLVPSLINPAWTAGLTGDVEGWYAEFRTSDGRVAQVSRLDGESGWTIDALFSPKGGPVFVNGFGARYLRTHAVTDGIADTLDANLPLEYQS